MFHKFAPLMLACAGDDDQCGHNATVQELLERIGDREPQQALFVVIFGLCVGGGGELLLPAFLAGRGKAHAWLCKVQGIPLKLLVLHSCICTGC